MLWDLDLEQGVRQGLVDGNEDLKRVVLSNETMQGNVGGNNFDAMFKVVLFGSGCVGKTTLLARYIQGIFINDSTMTIGVQYATKYVKTTDDLILKMQIWDTAGQSRYRYCQKYVERFLGRFLRMHLLSWSCLT